MFRHVLVPTDGSELSQRVVDRAIAFARDAGARLTLRTEGLGHPLALLAELGDLAGRQVSHLKPAKQATENHRPMQC